jgi:hypothetical protein
MSKTVTESLSDDDVSGIEDEVADAYGVDPEDVSVDIVYETTGSIGLNVTGEVSDEELEEALEDEIAALLGIHESNVDVQIQNGTAYYTITSDSAEDAQEAQNKLDEEDSSTIIDDAIEDSGLPVDVSEVNVNDDVTASVVVTVDTTGASNNLNNAADDVEKTFQDDGYADVAAESKSTFIQI